MKVLNDIELFCLNFRYLRLINGMSKQEMAELLNISKTTITSIEDGKLPPRLTSNVLFYIHKHFGIAPSKMFSPFAKLNPSAPHS